MGSAHLRANYYYSLRYSIAMKILCHNALSARLAPGHELVRWRGAAEERTTVGGGTATKGDDIRL
jgi:hypothetical protein